MTQIGSASSVREADSGAPILLLGATSVLGYSLARRYSDEVVAAGNPHNRAIAAGWHRIRVERPEEWQPLLEREAPACVIYAHAVCDVPKCEAHPEWAWRINVDALARFSEWLPPATRLVYLSSDHVFGGDGVYGESSAPAPISVYGRTRVAAEGIVQSRPGSLIVRYGLPIGRSLNGRTGFFDWLRHRSERGLPITVISDEARSAVWATDLAERILALVRSQITGVRHVAATRAIARPELAARLLRLQGLTPAFTIATRAEQPYPHLGRVELATEHEGALAIALPAVAASAA